ncbi:MAG: hypothetical protein HYY24_02125 [Verrucomicrobia bacterium]|nr:hypothetical protein [Verrucomicrobiota bacterium]
MHLKPVRAKLLTPWQSLRDRAWSSCPEYLKPPPQRWPRLRVERLLGGNLAAQGQRGGLPVRRRAQTGRRRQAPMKNPRDPEEIEANRRAGFFFAESARGLPSQPRLAVSR